MVEMTSSSSSMERKAMVGSVNPSMLGMVPGFSWSAPEQNPRPAPVMTTIRTSLSLPISRKASRKGIMTSKAMAFMRSGRLSVTTATCGWGLVISVKDMRGIVECAGLHGGRLCAVLRGRRRISRRPLLAGDPAQASRPGVPVVHDGGTGDEVVERAPVALVDDPEKPDTKSEEQGDPEADRSEDGLASADRPSLRGHHLQPEDRHAERLSAHRPLVREVEELPDGQHDEGGQLMVGQREGVPGHQLERGIEQCHPQGIDPPRRADIGCEGGQPADGAGVVPLTPDRERG